MDIVERLRKQKWQVLDEMRGLIEDTTAYEAADEIERLRESLRYYADKKEEDWKDGDDGVVARKALEVKE